MGLWPFSVARFTSGGDWGGSGRFPMRKYTSVHIICNGDGCRGDGSDGGCLQPCWTVRVMSDRDWRGPEGYSTQEHIEHVKEGGRGCVWGVNPLNEWSSLQDTLFCSFSMRIASSLSLRGFSEPEGGCWVLAAACFQCHSLNSPRLARVSCFINSGGLDSSPEGPLMCLRCH